jgi:hypothetical protein
LEKLLAKYTASSTKEVTPDVGKVAAASAISSPAKKARGTAVSDPELKLPVVSKTASES